MRIQVRNITYGGAHGDVVTSLCAQHAGRRAAESVQRRTSLWRTPWTRTSVALIPILKTRLEAS
ncbi:hypothetical protein JG687_00007374 [Phytophthora cactorum]|uniref:Uncharacterized protein n=1 Tax=Phytophthora cactorum TaxID=29920 RepID=A0A8T1UIG1_9STRA|nr:hypothetical protein JG687_00007374 [Phytophthora cactorum]